MSAERPVQTGDVRVLIVEDEPRMRDLLLRASRSWGFAVDAVSSGEQALRSMDAVAADVVVLDLNLPAMSGMECFEAIRRKWPRTQVIILTGFGDLEAARRAIHLDVVEFLTKPCHLGELEAALERAQRSLRPADALPEMQRDDEPGPISPGPASPSTTLDELEREHILAALDRHGGNRAAAAEELGISLRTLYYRLSEYQKAGHRVD